MAATIACAQPRRHDRGQWRHGWPAL